MKKNTTGFTIVELLIVIVVIAILATISVVAYRGIQGRARDSQRQQDIKTIAKALELYYIDKGTYPLSSCVPSCPTPKKINNYWATTSDGTWSVLEAALVPKYISSLPKDPTWSVNKESAIGGGSNYDHYGPAVAGEWCNTGNEQGYILTYVLEAAPRQTAVVGDCSSGSPPGYSSSWYYVKH